jgi:hypothetical protein
LVLLIRRHIIPSVGARANAEDLDAGMDQYWEADPEVAAARTQKSLNEDMDHYMSAPKAVEVGAEDAVEEVGSAVEAEA